MIVPLIAFSSSSVCRFRMLPDSAPRGNVASSRSSLSATLFQKVVEVNPKNHINMKIFPERLRLLRGSTSQEDMGRKYGFTQSAYAKWEAGRAEPKFDVLTKICKEYSVSSDWLLGLTDERACVSVTATGSSVAANHSTVRTGAGVSSPAEVTRLLGIIESQQRVIESLAAARR